MGLLYQNIAAQINRVLDYTVAMQQAAATVDKQRY
jgi:hypothetical protein